MGGLARRASAIDSFRKGKEGLVVLDAGDALLANPLAPPPLSTPDREKARAILQAEGMMGMAAMAVGEGELALGVKELAAAARQAGVTLLCANLVDRQGHELFTRRKIVETGGVKIGLFGLLDLSEPPGATNAILAREGLRTIDPVEAAHAQVKALQSEGAEVVILLAHVGIPQARRMAAQFTGVHLVVVGHSGYRLNEPERVGNTYLVEASRRGRDLGHVELRLGENWKSSDQLVDDSRRHVLYQEASAELKRVEQHKALRQRAQSRSLVVDELARAKALIKQLEAAPPPQATHSLIARLIELDETFTHQPAMQALLTARRAVWATPALLSRDPRATLQGQKAVRPPAVIK
jgi:2',3'-cyclic-nucleotide 2'-phosphodiesterase (5'-nucleotidase family)